MENPAPMSRSLGLIRPRAPTSSTNGNTIEQESRAKVPRGVGRDLGNAVS